MKQFNQVKIHKDNASLMVLVQKMKDLKNDYFYYDEESSERTNETCKNDSICGGTYYALFKTSLESLYFTTVYVSVKDDELKVFNITSSDHRYYDLGISRYNLVIDAFFYHVIERCIDESDTNCVSITGENHSLEEDLGSDVYNALKTWESQCKKDAPISHPLDENAWFTFVTMLHNSHKLLHPSDFGQWLTEDCQWPSFYNDKILEMEEKLEYSLSLLDCYDKFNKANKS